MVYIKIVTWNINGLRSAETQLTDFLSKYNPDILCLQEIKVDEKRLPDSLKNFDGYKSYWFHAEKPGYSGVAIYTKVEPRKIAYGIGEKEFDREGRAITLHFENFILVNLYLPHSGRELGRLDFKLKMNKAVERYISKFSDRILICGDLNVAHREIDLARPKDNVKNAGFTPVERKFMDELISLGFIDIFRRLHPDVREYTWWSQRIGVRARNIGWRIDYFLCKTKLFKLVKGIKILTQVYGSDHCPVLVELI